MPLRRTDRRRLRPEHGAVVLVQRTPALLALPRWRRPVEMVLEKVQAHVPARRIARSLAHFLEARHERQLATALRWLQLETQELILPAILQHARRIPDEDLAQTLVRRVLLEHETQSGARPPLTFHPRGHPRRQVLRLDECAPHLLGRMPQPPHEAQLPLSALQRLQPSVLHHALRCRPLCHPCRPDAAPARPAARTTRGGTAPATHPAPSAAPAAPGKSASDLPRAPRPARPPGAVASCATPPAGSRRSPPPARRPTAHPPASAPPTGVARGPPEARTRRPWRYI